ncbi:hypothetical protein CORC01_01611 [Colletotrichum orchidophilum]|uniref:Uncharacterized protein n=1 Tax=Colletotrichum orchidophilum TaxID=1209926 RepID=A0A1G4BPI4_9PEZI|nr:uncharacterized protein CORC01_01611 [Colletotrichum orchidophilum]OHF03227.1 hypothetical protein CORC01_01611 [Colletotrichum orchidophilum]
MQPYYLVAEEDDINIQTAELDDGELQMQSSIRPASPPTSGISLNTSESTTSRASSTFGTGKEMDSIYLQRIMDLSNAEYAVRNLYASLELLKYYRFRYIDVAATNRDRVISETESSVTGRYVFEYSDGSRVFSSLGIMALMLGIQ